MRLNHKQFVELVADDDVTFTIKPHYNFPQPPTYFARIGRVFFEYVPGREEWEEVTDLGGLMDRLFGGMVCWTTPKGE